MKLRRLAFILFAVLAFLSLPVYAHPGRTDSNGGHTDHSTGEYHYHHGYGPHQHYDIDGDGEADCPLENLRIEKEPSSSNSSNSSESSYDSVSSNKAEVSKKKNSSKSNLLLGIGICFAPQIICFIIGSVSTILKKGGDALHRIEPKNQKEGKP